MFKGTTILLVVFLALWLIPLSAGHAKKIAGPTFEAVEAPPEGKAVVYLYKPRAYGKGIYLTFVNGTPVTRLRKGGYYPHIVSPGEVEIVADKKARVGELLEVFNIEPDKRLTLSVQAGMVHYVKIDGTMKVRLLEVDEETALRELAKCRRLPRVEEK